MKILKAYSAQWSALLGLSLVFSGVQSHAITLAGTVVPKEKMIVYLLFGHSNIMGVDYLHTDDVTHPRAWTYQWYSSKTWILAKEAVNAKTKGLSGNNSGGPGMPFLKGMVAAYPDYYFGVINTASPSATCRGENQGGNGSGLDPADNRYWKGTYLYEQVLTQARAVQKDVTFGGILCMLGSVESTRTSEAVCRAFSDDITQLVKDLRADLGLPNLPFIMGEYESGSTGIFAISRPMPAIIAAETKLIPSKLSFSGTVSSDNITMLDDHHYTANKGQVEWAKRAIDLIQAKGFFPPNSLSTLRYPGRNTSASQSSSALILRNGRLKLISIPTGTFHINGAAFAPESNLKPH